MIDDVWALIAASYPGLRLESEIQGWAFLERFKEGLCAYNALERPSPQDDRWAAVCHFQLLEDELAVALLIKASERGEAGAEMYLAHVYSFLDKADEADIILSRVVPSSLTPYDQALFARIRSMRAEMGGNLREALQAAEEAWRRIQGLPEYKALAPSVLAQLAVLHGRIGRSQRALWFLERAIVDTTGQERLKVQLRRAAVLVNLGRNAEAEVELGSLGLLSAPPYFQAERKWLLGEIAWSKGDLLLAETKLNESVRLAQKYRFLFEEFKSRIALLTMAAASNRKDTALSHLRRAQVLISDKSDRLVFRFREILVHYWLQHYSFTHALAELEGLIIAFSETGLLQEQAAAMFHKAELLFSNNREGWREELDRILALSISLQNPALLSKEWALKPEFNRVAAKTHKRIAGEPTITLSVKTIGVEELWLGDVRVQIPLKRSIELLAYFLEHKAVSLEQVLSDVFPNENPRSARSYFHQFRHQLREAIPLVSIEYDTEVRLYRVQSELNILWDVMEFRAGRSANYCGPFLPTSTNPWAKSVEAGLTSLHNT